MKAVIFDLDGVLCSTDHFHYKAWKVIADEEGIYFDEKINNRLRGVSRLESLNIILEKANRNYSLSEKEILANKKNEIYKSFIKNMKPSDVDEDTRLVLIELKQRNYKLAIGSSSKNTKMILEALDLLKYFDEICDGNDITHSKPDPEVFLKASQMLGIDASECYVVEDAFSGIDAAKEGGFTAIGINDAATYEKTDIKIKYLKDLLSIL